MGQARIVLGAGIPGQFARDGQRRVGTRRHRGMWETPELIITGQQRFKGGADEDDQTVSAALKHVGTVPACDPGTATGRRLRSPWPPPKTASLDLMPPSQLSSMTGAHAASNDCHFSGTPQSHCHGPATCLVMLRVRWPRRGCKSARRDLPRAASCDPQTLGSLVALETTKARSLDEFALTWRCVARNARRCTQIFGAHHETRAPPCSKRARQVPSPRLVSRPVFPSFEYQFVP
jgi:hypothetical protein